MGWVTRPWGLAEAETMATVLLELGNQRLPVAVDPAAPQHAEITARLRDALEDRSR